MKKKKIIAALSVSVLLVAATVGATLAYFTDSDSKSNVITMGKVDGTLTESDEKVHEDGSVGQEFNHIKPGQIIYKDPKVTLNDDSEDAYVRVSVNYTGLTEQQKTDVDEAIEKELQMGWGKGTDGYLYYNTKLTAGDSSVVFDSFIIPANWGNEVADMMFHIDVTAEFIQADNFNPQRTDTGYIIFWDDVEIESYTSK